MMATTRDAAFLDRERPAWRLSTRPFLVVSAIVLSSTAAQAQINPFRSYSGPVLSKADLQQGMRAADKLLTTDGAKVGASENWTGATSGNSGTLTVQREFQQKNNSCRTLKSAVRYKDGTQRTWTLDVCRIPSGEWKVV